MVFLDYDVITYQNVTTTLTISYKCLIVLEEPIKGIGLNIENRTNNHKLASGTDIGAIIANSGDILDIFINVGTIRLHIFRLPEAE